MIGFLASATIGGVLIYAVIEAGGDNENDKDRSGIDKASEVSRIEVFVLGSCFKTCDYYYSNMRMIFINASRFILGDYVKNGKDKKHRRR